MNKMIAFLLGYLTLLIGYLGYLTLLIRYLIHYYVKNKKTPKEPKDMTDNELKEFKEKAMEDWNTADIYWKKADAEIERRKKRDE